jgi:hypothetical protein
LVTQGWVDDKPFLVTVTVARPDIASGYPERQQNRRYTLQIISGKALPIMKKLSWH